MAKKKTKEEEVAPDSSLAVLHDSLLEQEALAKEAALASKFLEQRVKNSINTYDLIELAVSETIFSLKKEGYAVPNGINEKVFRVPTTAQGYYAGLNAELVAKRWRVLPNDSRQSSQIVSDKKVSPKNGPYGYYVTSMIVPRYDLSAAILSGKFISEGIKLTPTASLLVDLQKEISDYITDNSPQLNTADRVFQNLYLKGFVSEQSAVNEVLLQQLLVAVTLGSPNSTLSSVALKSDSNLSCLTAFAMRINEATTGRGGIEAGNPQFVGSYFGTFMQRTPTFPLIRRKGVSSVQTHFNAHSKMSEAVVSYFMEKVRLSQFDLRPRLDHLTKMMKTQKRRVVIKEVKIRFQGDKIDSSEIRNFVTEGNKAAASGTSLGLRGFLPLDFVVKKYTSADAVEALLVGTTLIMNVTIPQWISNGLSSFELASLELSLANVLKTDQTLMTSSSLKDRSFEGVTNGRADIRRHFLRTPSWNSMTWDETRRTFYYQKDKSVTDLELSRSTAGSDRKLKGDNGIAPFTLEGATEICASLASTHSYPRGVARAGEQSANADPDNERPSKFKSVNPFNKAGIILDGDPTSTAEDFAVMLGGHVALNKMTQLVALHWMDLMLIAYSTKFRDMLEVGGAARSVYLSIRDVEDIVTEEYVNAAIFAGWNEGEDCTRSRQVFFGRFKS